MDAFANFRKTLDREMMKLTKTGKGTVKKQAEAFDRQGRRSSLES